MLPIQTEILPNGIILLKLSGDLTNPYLLEIQRALEESTQGIEQLYSVTKAPLLCLLDLSHFTGSYDQDVMEEFAAFAKQIRDKIKWVSGFGGNEKANLAAEAIVILDGHDNMDLFATREEALAALEMRM